MAELKRVLSYKVLLLIIINSIMGTGIFFLPAIGARIGGAASIVSWAIMAAIAIYISMCFAELCSMYPSAGGTYEFCKHAYGRAPSFLVGWLTLIGGNITIAMLIIGAISYLLPAHIPNLELIVMIISVIFIVIFNTVAYRGMKTSATMLVTFSFITLGTLLAIMLPSVFTFQPGNFLPFFSNGYNVMFLAIFFIAETFFGWESPTFLAGETRDGEKVVPRAMITGTKIIAVVALLFVVLSMGSLGWNNLGLSDAPLSDLAQFHFGSRGMQIFMILAYLSIIGSVAGWVVSAPRLILSMAKDKLFLPKFSRIHPRFQTPHMAIIFQCIVSIVFVFLGLGSYETLLHLLVPILLITYSLVMLALVILRYRRPDVKRYYRAPFGRIGPLFVILFFIALLVTWLVLTPGASDVLFKGVTLMLLGVPIYFLLEMYSDPKMIRFVNDISAEFTLLTERISLPLSVRREIIRLLGNVKGRTLLEFGCSVGTLTMHLAEEVGPKGKIYATDISKRVLSIAKKRLEKKGHSHVETIHDAQHHRRVHPKVPRIHTVVSVGTLGYMKDAKNALMDMNRRLKVGSKICFLDYDKFFDIIPAVDWLEDDGKIKQVFSDAGFDVNIERKQGFAWKYLYIYGKKTKNITSSQAAWS